MASSGSALDINEHLQIGTVDPVAYELALDARSHDAPRGMISGP